MRIPSGKIDQSIFFIAVDINDLRTKKTGLTSFTVRRSRNAGSSTAYTTPTIVEIDSTNMPGLYALLIDEDTTIASGSDSEEYAVYITQASMAPVYRTIELYRRGVTTGVTALVDSNGRVDVIKVAGTTQTAGDLAATQATIASYIDTEVGAIKTKTDQLVFTVANQVDVNVVDWKGATAPAMTGDAFARLGAPAGASHSADVAAVKVDTAAVKAKTDNLPASPAAVADIPTANANADALLDRANGIETGWTLRQAMRIALSVLGGKASGQDTTTGKFRDVTDAKDRVTATLDGAGNRTAVTLDAT